MHHQLAAGVCISAEGLRPVCVNPVIGQRANAVRPAGLREVKHRKRDPQRNVKRQRQCGQTNARNERQPKRPLLPAGRNQHRASPRVIGAKAPQMPFQVVAAKATAAIVFVPDLHRNPGTARLGTGVDGIRIVDDEVG